MCHYCRICRNIIVYLGFWVLLSDGASAAERTPLETAVVSDGMQRDPNYVRYCQLMIQLDLLAKPATAGLTIAVDSREPGVLSVNGVVPNEKTRRLVLESARRISGLAVKDLLSSGPPLEEYLVHKPDAEQEQATIETLESLFPESAEQVQVKVHDGVVSLSGTADSHETRLLISQSIKSQPACKAVVNLLVVQPDAEGMVHVTDNGEFRLRAAELPVIPPAPLTDGKKDEARPSIRSLTARSNAGAADDSPEADTFDRQLREDIQAKIAGQKKLSSEDAQVDVQQGVAIITGKFRRREMLEAAADAAAEVSGVRTILVKGKPFTIQRHVPPKSSLGVRKTSDEADESKPNKLQQWLGLGGPKEGEGLASSWRYRDMVKRSIKKRCEDRFHNLSIRSSLNGMVIEGEVETVRDRTFVLRQIEEVSELRSVRYDAVVRVRGLK